MNKPINILDINRHDEINNKTKEVSLGFSLWSLEILEIAFM